MKQIYTEKAEAWLKTQEPVTYECSHVMAFAAHLDQEQECEESPGACLKGFGDRQVCEFEKGHEGACDDGAIFSKPTPKEQECVCGEPHASDMIVHRTDGPCYAKPTPSDKAEKFIKNHPDYDYGAYETEVIMKFCEYLEQEHYE